MTQTDANASGHVEDLSTYLRVQQANQLQVFGKLLHDVRNPLHSIRIAVEIFARVAQPGADAPALLPRVARYAGPAQVAAEVLSKQLERLAVYLGPPRAPALQPVGVNELLADVAVLLGDAKPPRQAELDSSLPDEIPALADRPRLSNGLLAWCLEAEGSVLTLRAREHEGQVQLTTGAPAPAADIREILQCAGGRWRTEEGGRAAIWFARA